MELRLFSIQPSAHTNQKFRLKEFSKFFFGYWADPRLKLYTHDDYGHCTAKTEKREMEFRKRQELKTWPLEKKIMRS